MAEYTIPPGLWTDIQLDDEDEQLTKQWEREQNQYCKEIEGWLWAAMFNGFEITPHNGLVFITNKDKTRAKQLAWLKKYVEVLRKHGIQATVDDWSETPCICI